LKHIALFLKDIKKEKKSGRLMFLRKPIKKFLFFQKGSLTYALSNLSQERIGKILFRLGNITDKTLAKIELYIEPKRHIGEVLIDNGLVTKSQLQEALEFQMREITLNIFPIFDGEFSFEEVPVLEMDEGELRLDINSLMADGIRRMDETLEMEQFFSERELTTSEREEGKNILLTQERELLETMGTLDPKYTVDPFHTESAYWKRLFLLFCLDLIKFRLSVKPQGDYPDEELPDLSLAEGAQLNKVLKLASGLDDKDYYQILDVSREADSETFKHAYFSKARDFHPDRFDRRLPLKIKNKIQMVFDRINKAYRTINSADSKRNYDQSLGRTETELRHSAQQSAEQHFRKARELYEQAHFKEAVPFFSHAVKLQPSKAAYVFFLARAQAEIPLFRKQAESGYMKAIQMEPWNPEMYLCLGRMYLEEGLTIKAEKLFRKALHVDPDYDPANKALQLLEREKKYGARGRFSLKRKK
jgi:curved DNA-binding protein CbpA